MEIGGHLGEVKRGRRARADRTCRKLSSVDSHVYLSYLYKILANLNISHGEAFEAQNSG
jgi:hypothetical protein